MIVTLLKKTSAAFAPEDGSPPNSVRRRAQTLPAVGSEHPFASVIFIQTYFFHWSMFRKL